MRTFFRTIRWLIWRRHKESELQEEIQFHLDEEAEEQAEVGLVGEEVRLAARRDFGNIAQLKEATRAAWGWRPLEQAGQDIRYAIRAMTSNRLFTALAILSLALGIGANTAIYSFIDAVVLRPLPVNDPWSLVVMNWRMKRPTGGNFGPKVPATVMFAISGSTYSEGDEGMVAGVLPYPAFELLRKSESVFSSVFGWYPLRDLSVVIKGEADLVAGVYVTGDYFRGLGINPAAGRLLVTDDDRAGASPVAIVSFGYSQRHFGSTQEAVGQAVLLNNVPFTIAGVAPLGFLGVDPAAVPDFYVPMHANLLLDLGGRNSGSGKYVDQNFYWLRMMGRLQSGTTPAAAEAALSAPFRQWANSTAQNDRQRANLPALVLNDGSRGADGLRRLYEKPLYILMILVGLILAVACANIANLLLARGAARAREISVRMSLGASRWRVVRQLMTESLTLAGLGGLLGIAVGMWGIRFLTLLLQNSPGNLPPQAELNWRVLGVAAAISVVTGLIFGLAPAIQATRLNLIPGLSTGRGGRGHTGMRGRLSETLMIFQIAMSLLMLVAAGLFAGTLTNYRSVSLGFDPDRLLLTQVNARQAGYRGLELVSFYESLQRDLVQIPGVRDVSLSGESLVTAGTGLPITFPGYRPSEFCCNVMFAGPSFFSTMGIPVLLGREFDQRDGPSAPMVAVINEEFALTAFANENPIGLRLTMASDSREMEIVGVVKDFQYGGLGRKARPVVIVPYNQGGFTFIDRMTFVLRTDGDPLAFAAAVRAAVHKLDSRVPVANIISQQDDIARTLSREIMFARLCTAFAVLAVVIACVGLYGTVSYSVAERTAEIGIRMALGAKRARVVRMILRKILVCTVVALVIGLPLVLLASQQVQAYLFEMKPNDPRTIAEAVTILLVAIFLAAFVPALRASRIDPTVALRHE